MIRTPDEIKKGLECCAASYADCHKECPYKLDCDGSQILKDALALIRWHEEKNEAMHAEIVRLQAERDAAVALIPRACAFCKWCGVKNGGFFPDCKNPNGCRNISGNNAGWEWRGVQKEETT